MWHQFPNHYRASEVQMILRSVSAGDCVAVIGLSGSGKSNLLGFLANRIAPPTGFPAWILVDCNRTLAAGITGFMFLMLQELSPEKMVQNHPAAAHQVIYGEIEHLIATRVRAEGSLCLLMDRFDALFDLEDFHLIANGLRALRDQHKYRLTYVVSSRRPLNSENELAELFFDHTIWLGPLQPEDAQWSARRDADRYRSATGLIRDWNEDEIERLAVFSNGYPSLLRAACRAYADGAELDADSLFRHPAVKMRIDEFWADDPDPEILKRSGIAGVRWLMDGRPEQPKQPDLSTRIDSMLTEKEALLLDHFQKHAGEVCHKDDLIQAVWPEDVIFKRGIRDESLAQLIRRLRVKIEPSPNHPVHIRTVTGRGYIFHP